MRVAAEHDWQPVVAAAFIVLRSLSVLYPPAPGFPMDILAIRLFGATAGLVLAECGIMLGASIAFLVARLASRRRQAAGLAEDWPLLRRLKNHLPNTEMTTTQQFRFWFLLRLLTNPLFDPISYLAGLSSSRFRTYFLGSLLGNVPTTLLFFTLEAKSQTSTVVHSLAVAILFCVFLIIVADRFLPLLIGER